MYSSIPMPYIEWNKSTMKYAMCFFPFVGVVIGLIVYFFNYIATLFNISPFLYSSLMVIIPPFLSGAIHVDGFIDTSDAIHSHQDKDRKLEILKDSHVGAFGVIMCIAYVILQFGLFGQFFENSKHIILLCLGFVLSRSLSSLSIVTFKTAKNTGLVHIFSNNADKNKVRNVMIIFLIILYALMLFTSLITGGICIFASIIWFLLYKRLCYKGFGGITGDLAGYFLQIMELLILIICVCGVNL